MLSPEKIKELQEILNRVYNQNIDFEQTSEIAHLYKGYFGLLAKLNKQITNEK